VALAAPGLGQVRSWVDHWMWDYDPFGNYIARSFYSTDVKFSRKWCFIDGSFLSFKVWKSSSPLKDRVPTHQNLLFISIISHLTYYVRSVDRKLFRLGIILVLNTFVLTN